MVENKKYFWVLTAAPLYFLYCVLLKTFFGFEYSVYHVVFLSLFALSVSVILAFKSNFFISLSFVIVQIALLVTAFFLLNNETLKQLAGVYALYYLPAFSLLLSFKSIPNNSHVKKNDRESKQKHLSDHRILVEFLLLFALVVFMISFFNMREDISFQLDATAAALLLLCVLLIILFAVLGKNGGAKKPALRSVFIPVMIMSLFDILVYVTWANRYVQDRVYLLFPIVLTLIIILEDACAFKNSEQSKKNKQ